MRLQCVQKINETIQLNVVGESDAELVLVELLSNMKLKGVDLEDDKSICINFTIKEKK